MKTKNKRNYSKENGITLIALVVTIVVLLILAGVSVNALFGNNGIIEKAKEAQNAMDKAKENDERGINELTNWLDNQVNGTIEKEPVNVSRGAFVEYNVAYKDAYEGYDYTVTNGWRLLDYTKNEDGTYSNVKLISTGIPAILYYYYSDTTNNSWYVTDSTKLTNFKNVLGSEYDLYTGTVTYYGLQASAGLYYNFGDIKFAYGTSSRGNNLGYFTEIASNGKTYNSTNTTETTGSNLFIPTGVSASVRLLTLPEMNTILGRTDIDSKDKMTDPTGADGLFVLQNIKNITGMSSNTYGVAYDSGRYWLASPFPGDISDYKENVVSIWGYRSVLGDDFADGMKFDSYYKGHGVRPVISLTSNNVQFKDIGNGILKID